MSGMPSTDIHDLGDMPRKPGIPAPRLDPTASFLKFALKNRDSEAARTLRVQDHSLTDSQINELDNRVNYTLKKSSGGFFSNIWDYVVTAFQCLVGQFTGDCGFKDFSSIKASRGAMRTARAVHEALLTQGPDGTSSFASMAERVSGVKPDGKGGYVPVLDERGQATGFYKASLDRSLDPKTSFLEAQEDRGMQPSKTQRERSEAIYKEEVGKLYQDPELRALVIKFRPDPMKPGKDTEAVDFVNDPKVMKRITAIADRFMTDEELKKGGSFKYDKAQVREKLIGRIKWRIASEHKDNAKGIPAAGAVPDMASPKPELGELASPFTPATPATDTSRALP